MPHPYIQKLNGTKDKLLIALIASVIPVLAVIYSTGGMGKQMEITTEILKTHVEVTTREQDSARQKNTTDIAVVKQRADMMDKVLDELREGQEAIRKQNERILSRLPHKP